MTNKLKKFLATLLAMSMILSMVSVSAFADEGPEEGNTTPTVTQEEQKEEEQKEEEKQEVGQENQADPADTSEENGEQDGEANIMPLSLDEPEPQAELTEAQRLQAAINEAVDGVETTVTMTADITGMTTAEIITIPEGKVIVLDMAGHSITVAGDFAGRPIANKGTLTVQGNGKIDATNSRTGGYGAIRNDGTLTMMDGEYIGNVYADAGAIRNGAGASMTMCGGKIAGSQGIFNAGDVTIYKGEIMTLACSGCGTPYGYALNNRDDGSASGKMWILPEKDEDVLVHGTQGALASVGGAEVHVQGGTFYTEPCENDHKGNTFYAVYVSGKAGAPAKCVVDGGKFSTTGSVACIYVNNTNPADNGGAPGQGILEINGGSFDQGSNGAKLVTFTGTNGSRLAISGGEFKADVTEYVVPTAAYDPATGKVEPLTAETGVAEVGGKYYSSLRAAINAATEGQTVTLLQDAHETVVIDKDLTLNGAGKSVILDADVAQNVTGIAAVNGESMGYMAVIAATNGANVTVENLTIESSEAVMDTLDRSYRHIGIAALNANVTVKNSTVKDMCYTDNVKGIQNGISIYAVSTDATTLTLENVSITNFNKGGIVTRANVNLVMDGCTVTGWGETTLSAQNGIQYSGNATIKNTTISGLKYTADNQWKGGAMAIMNYPGSTQTTSVIENVTCTNVDYAIATYANGTTEIKSGNFNGEVWGDEGTLSISGGTFSSDVSDYCIEGLEAAQQDESGKWVIVPAENMVAQIVGGGAYATLQAAIAAATEGQTVTLLTDVTIDSTAGKNQATIAIPAGVTLDGNGKTITAGTFAAQAHMLGVVDAANVTIRNLTVDMGKAANSKHALNVCGATASATLENVTLKNANAAGMVVNAATVTATGLTTEGNGWGAVNVDKKGTFTMTSGALAENNKIWSEDAETENGSTITVPEGWNWVEIGGKKVYTTGLSISLDRTTAALYSNTTPNTVTLTLTAPEGATVTWTTSDEAVATVDENGVVTAVADGTATITATVGGMTATCAVTVSTYTAPYVPPYVPPVTTPNEELSENDTPLVERPWTFVDVMEKDWFYGDVKTMFDRGVIGGMSETAYEPYTNATRAMVATLLYRMAGSPSVADLDVTVTDVAAKSWYHDAAVWAYATGVFNGYSDGSFQGGKNISREELAAVLSRYAAAQGLDVTADADLSGFTDASGVSKWAVSTMKWAVSVGLINGREGRLAAGDFANRAELATMLVRFDKLLEAAGEE